jgi:hypothetical protein
MAKHARKLWVGVGMATIAGAAATGNLGAQDADHKTHSQPPPAQKAGAAGKLGGGGEAYLTDGGPRDTRIRFYRDIALMRGHLLVGGELIGLELWDEALPHFLHPGEELYASMEKYIRLHSMQPFGRELQALAQTVKAGRKGAYEQALKPVDQRLEAALGVAKKFMRPEQSFAIKSAIAVLRVAQSEYEAAMQDGRFTKPVEYQDSRGFVWRAERVIEAAAQSEPHPIGSEAMGKVRAAFAKLKTAWPTPLPPAKPILDVSQVSALISEIELYISSAAR